jgi:hypothetical protein
MKRSVFFSLCFSSLILAAASDPGKAQAPDATPKPEREVIKLKISTMRKSSTAGKGLGVYAELENVTSNTLTIFSGETVLVVPPELVGKGVCVLTFGSIAPTEVLKFDKPAPDPRGYPVMMKPGEKYRAFWDLTSPSTDPVCWDVSPPADPKQISGTHAMPAGFWASVKDSLSLRMTGFVPGPYNFTVEGKAYADAGPDHVSDYYTFVDSADLNMEIPESLVTVGAIVGGSLGYLVAATRPNGDFSGWSDVKSKSEYLSYAWMIFYKLFSASLLSVVVTILLSRLSDTQFAIKVSVSDFWGAITIGFLSYFLGNKLIDQILRRFNAPSPGSEPVPPTPAPPTPAPHGGPVNLPLAEDTLVPIIITPSTGANSAA